MLVTGIRKLADEPIEIRRAIGTIICGFPSPAQDYDDEKRNVVENLSRSLIRDPVSTFVMDAYGDSMTPSILSGDLLIVDRGAEPQDGGLVVAVVDGEFTAKRLIVRHGRPVLRSENSAYSDIEVPELSDFTVWGSITWILHRTR
ncbi:DNA polymerase V [Leucobacter luti]|uniref:DNA polymerase V n=1 Tax=Leucobacter luti TaxID=340320 RepID=A0A4R6S046_9MICO|nr:translesion error-prone DNA polymerase V autoproteolytic subunit [Leucobacter luti]TDP92297.1 DNA polymerase V [Leucobacter luti]